MADPEAYTKEELAALRSQILSNLEQAWEIADGSEDQLPSTIVESSRVMSTWIFSFTTVFSIDATVVDAGDYTVSEMSELIW